MSAHVKIYLKDWCPYCAAARALLDNKGICYESIDLVADPLRRAEMESLSGRTSVPQIFIDDQHIGGFDDMNALERRGELDAMLR